MHSTKLPTTLTKNWGYKVLSFPQRMFHQRITADTEHGRGDRAMCINPFGHHREHVQSPVLSVLVYTQTRHVSSCLHTATVSRSWCTYSHGPLIPIYTQPRSVNCLSTLTDTLQCPCVEKRCFKGKIKLHYEVTLFSSPKSIIQAHTTVSSL